MKLRSIVAVVIGLSALCGRSDDILFRAPSVIPAVQEMSFASNVEVRLESGMAVTVACPDAGAVAWTASRFRDWFGADISPAAAADGVPDGDEAYRLCAEPGRIKIAAKTLAGVRYAMYTLRQIAEALPTGETVAGYRVPKFEISDEPRLKFRGLHVCWFPEVRATFIEHMIRLAAYYKYNYMVIESWGVFQSEKHPWFSLKGGPMTKAEIRRLSAVAKDVGITLIPQLNIFGHAAASRIGGGKHVALDYHPERKCLFEPVAGWNWCLSNPASTAVVKDLVVELHEAFGNPPYFHIGCDEAEKPSCASCRAKPYSQLVFAHINAVHDLLASRGARAMMWHDKLLNGKDGRWKGYYAYGDDETASVVEKLPKDIVICDWHYGKQVCETGAYPTADYFKSLGFEVVTSPWTDIPGIRVQTKHMRDHGFKGVLQTVWNEFRGCPFARLMEVAACAAWSERDSTTGWSALGFSTHWRECGCDMGLTDYADTGYYDTQSTRDVLSY